MNLCIIFGGKSSEYEVSLRSACAVLENIDKSKYDIVKIGITKNGKWYKTDASPSEIAADEWQRGAKELVCDLNRGVFVTSEKEIIKPDVVFPVMHGENVENGTLQGVFEAMNVKYIGCNVKSSALAYDKHFSKLIAEICGIKVAKYRIARRWESEEKILKRAKGLEYHVFVKPAEVGSSCGITKVKGVNNLLKALDFAFEYCDKVIIEEQVVGKEVEIAIAQSNGKIVMTECGEITYSSDFYDYDTKYKSNDVGYQIPANIDTSLEKKLKSQAKRLFCEMGCTGLSRIDFFVTENEVIFNEINTLPGFTEASMFPMLFEKKGVSFKRLIDMLIKNVNFY